MYKSFIACLRYLSMGIALLCAGLATVHAGQSAALVCVEEVSDGGCQRYELRVTITSETDVGKVGAFGIGVHLSNDGYGYWTVARGFQEFQGGLVIPTEGVFTSLPASRTYVVYSGPLSGICALARYKNFELYAGHGIVPPDKEAQVQWLLSKNLKVSADHIRGAFIQSDVIRSTRQLSESNWKAGMVYSRQCDPGFGDQ
jgi:hypothetical protein